MKKLICELWIRGHNSIYRRKNLIKLVFTSFNDKFTNYEICTFCGTKWETKLSNNSLANCKEVKKFDFESNSEYIKHLSTNPPSGLK